tara:strand:- start:265 stop:420 length:156 start_codon:yes stop_codon:yes gene_type:complete
MKNKDKIVSIVLIMVVVLVLGLINMFVDIWPAPVLAAIVGVVFWVSFIRAR